MLRSQGLLLALVTMMGLSLGASCATRKSVRTPPSPAPPPVGPVNHEETPKIRGNRNYATIEVFYGTDRKESGFTGSLRTYGAHRGELAYGTCKVSIPRDHRLGELERPSVLSFEFRYDPDKHVTLLEVLPRTEQDFFSHLSTRVGQSEGKEAFVFIHGYNITFEDTARRTAQMHYDLGFDGAPIFYSWPSQGTVAGYTVDETNIEWTLAHLKQFLFNVASRSGARSVHLIAHSMGNRGLTRALIELAQEHGPEIRDPFREIVLTAPDIDTEIFKRDIAPRLGTPTSRITLYASCADEALALSKQVHGYPRAGDCGDGLVIVEGVETVDVTAVKTSFFGHSYYAESSSVIYDLFQLLRRRPVERRHGLLAVRSPQGIFWRLINPNP